MRDRLPQAMNFPTFFDANRDRAGRYAFVLTGSAAVADDIVQDAFVAMFRRWDQIENPEGYLWRSVINGVRSRARRERRVQQPDPEASGETDVDAIAIRIALDALPDDERELLVLRYFVGLSDSQIAEAVKRPLGTVKTVIRRGLTMMKEALDVC